MLTLISPLLTGYSQLIGYISDHDNMKYFKKLNLLEIC